MRQKYGSSSTVSVQFSGKSFDEVSSLLKGINGVKSVSKNSSDPGSSFDCAVLSVQEGIEIRPEIAKTLVQNNISVYEISLQKNSLEDIFHTLTEE